MEKEKQRKIVVLSAPSGTGKSTIVKNLLATHTDFAFSISTTTRKPRANEQDGVHYYFVSLAEFEKKIQENAFLEYAFVHGNYYGTLKSEIDRIISRNQYCLLDIDVQGGEKILQIFPYCKMIFILPPSLEELKKRLSQRGDTTEEQIALRLSNAKKELSYIPHYHYFVVNDQLELAISTIEKIIYAP